MPRAKANPVIKAEEMTTDETKQMDDLRKTDSESQDIPEETPAETKAEPAEGEPKPEQKNTMVPHAALEEERQRRKAAEKKAQEAEQNQARLDERLNLINQALEKNNKKPETSNEPIDPEKDAMGAVKMTMEEVKQLKQFKENIENNQKTAQQIGAVTSRAMELEREFITTTPDYTEASNYLIASRRGELAALGYNDQQIQQQIYQESLTIAVTSMQQGKNPSEVIYNVAKLRGYAKKDAPANNGQTQPTQSEAEKLARIAEAQKANQSIGNVNGGAPNNSKMDAKTLATMPEKDFAKVLKSLSESDLQNIMGA